MKRGLRKFFPSKGGIVIGPAAMLSLLSASWTLRPGLTPSLTFALFVTEIIACIFLAYAMHWNQLKSFAGRWSRR